MISATSVKALLKNRAKELGKTIQDELITYGLERTIYRLSISDYCQHFTLKGGVFLYGLFNGDFVRATMDINLLGNRISNNIEEIKDVFKKIFLIKCDDALVYDLSSINVRSITEFKKISWC